ncbi:Rv3654c family TadE-like protein [Streptomyces sp. NPDC088350]|uniref:Rv3654c family TadE-like protein n=1 Tax=Streptomyces sp. NPDC088350 TaxID=3365854 RepID=UPI0038177F7C
MRRRAAPLGHGRSRHSDRGSATVWSLGAMAVLCVVFGVVLGLGQAVVARHRAAGGADLAALAAADHWAEGGAGACARAELVARAQGTRLVRCAVVGETSDVTAAAGPGPFAAEVRARAGPAGPVPPPAPAPTSASPAPASPLVPASPAPAPPGVPVPPAPAPPPASTQ